MEGPPQLMDPSRIFGKQRGWRRRAALLASCAVLLVAGCSGSETLESGPIDVPNPHYATTAREVGKVFTDGFEVIKFPSSVKRLKLISLEMVGDDALEVVGWKVADENRRFGAVQYLPWPPLGRGVTRESQHDGPGYVTDVPPVQYESGLQLLIGVKPTRLGYLERRGFYLTYAADGQKFRTFFDAGLYVCSEPQAVPRDRVNDCEDPEDKGREPHFTE